MSRVPKLTEGSLPSSRTNNLNDLMSCRNSSRPASSVRIKRENTNRGVRNNRLIKAKFTPSTCENDYLLSQTRLIREANEILRHNKFGCGKEADSNENKVANLSDYEDPQIKLKLITNLNPFLSDHYVDPDSEEVKKTLKATVHASLIKDYELSGIKPTLERPKFTPSPEHKLTKFNLDSYSIESSFNESFCSTTRGIKFILIIF